MAPLVSGSQPALDIDPRDLAEVLQILHEQVPDIEVWAFGSRVKHTAKPYSDLPMRVDVVDWASTSESFRRIIALDKAVVQTPE